MQPMEDSPEQSCGRTSQERSRVTEEQISTLFSGRWQTSGVITSSGTAWTRNGSECPSDGAESSSLLSSILLPPSSVPVRYSLSARAAVGVLQRSAKRGVELPIALKKALEAIANRTG